MARFDLADFLHRTGFSLRKLATYLQVAPGYLEAALTGDAALTARDRAACRILWRRLFKGKQLELPFAEPLETFTRNHARARARARGATSAADDRSSPRDQSPRAAKKRRAISQQQA